ncbi:MAG: hypothetical protein ACOX5A_08485 [Aminivibrio sp.]|jgi:hypothetical protein
MRIKCHARALLPLFFAAALIYAPFQAFGADRKEVFVSSPWLFMVARFVGGVNMEVRPIQYWNAEGVAARRIQRQRIPSDSFIIALDSKEAESLGLKKNQYPNLSPLYGTAPFDRDRAEFQYSDPSVLPFIAQRMLTVLSRFDPGSYPYYQRRLSEFQTRLDSTVLVGRQLLKGYPVFDLSGGFSSLLSAAGCDLLPGDEKRTAAWARGEDLEGLAAAVDDALKKKIPVIMDGGTPKTVRTALKNNKNVLSLLRPGEDQDLLIYFHDQFLILWNRLAPLREERQEGK